MSDPKPPKCPQSPIRWYLVGLNLCQRPGCQEVDMNEQYVSIQAVPLRNTQTSSRLPFSPSRVVFAMTHPLKTRSRSKPIRLGDEARAAREFPASPRCVALLLHRRVPYGQHWLAYGVASTSHTREQLAATGDDAVHESATRTGSGTPGRIVADVTRQSANIGESVAVAATSPRRKASSGGR